MRCSDRGLNGRPGGPTAGRSNRRRGGPPAAGVTLKVRERVGFVAKRGAYARSGKSAAVRRHSGDWAAAFRREPISRSTSGVRVERRVDGGSGVRDAAKRERRRAGTGAEPSGSGLGRMVSRKEGAARPAYGR
jgi:hypothetical protein